MDTIKLLIDIPKQMYLNAKADILCGGDILVKAIKNGIPHETVTEFADRCRECGKMRKGHWIDTGSESFEFHRVYKCSECGNTEIEYPEGIRGHFRYCPNCGARMESESKE